VGRTFGRLGDLDDTSYANQEWDSAPRTMSQPARELLHALPSDGPGDVRGTHQHAKLALVFPGERKTPLSGWSKAESALDAASGVPAGGCMTYAGHLRQGCSASACASKSPRRC
jgi:hypothetical protein